jgi:hypothetical protein
MAIYTGNDGTMFLAPTGGTGLVGVFTVPVWSTGGRLPINIGEIFNVATFQGSGRGAQVRAIDFIPAGSADGTICRFEVVVGGTGYAVGNQLAWARTWQPNLWIQTTPTIVTESNTAVVENILDTTEDPYRVAKIRGWTLNSNSEVVETTSLGDTTKTYAPSITSNDGTATLLFYEQDSGFEQFGDIYEYIDILFPTTTPREVRVNLLISKGTFTRDGGDYWKTNFAFNAFITSASIGVSYGEVVTVETNFTVNGPLRDRPWKGGQVY